MEVYKRLDSGNGEDLEKIELEQSGRNEFQIEQNPSGELEANFISKALYLHFSKLMKIGFKRPVEQIDLFDLVPEETPHNLSLSIEDSWEKERAKGSSVKHLVFAIVKPIWKGYALIAIPLMISILMELVSPLITFKMISFAKGTQEPIWKGFIYTAIVLIASSFSSILNQYQMLFSQRYAIRV